MTTNLPTNAPGTSLVDASTIAPGITDPGPDGCNALHLYLRKDNASGRDRSDG